MHDDSILVAIEDALRSSSFCQCGKSFGVTNHDDAMWLECHVFERPSRLPAPVAGFLRSLMHERTFVVAIPAELAETPAAAARAPKAKRVPAPAA